MATNKSVEVEFRGKNSVTPVAKAVADAIASVAPASDKAGAASSEAFKKMKADGERAGNEVDSLKKKLESLRSEVLAYTGLNLGAGMVKDAITTADAFNNLQARIKLATGEGANFTASLKEVSAIALRTGSNVEQTGILFTRLAEAGKSAGLGTQAAIAQALSLTETINQAVQISGGSAEASKAAVTQLIQGLQSGVLRGEEFNSVMEQAPRLSKALADSLGVTSGELRKMAEAGTLSADTVIKALKGQSTALAAEFATLPATVGRSVENLKTQWMLYLGEVDKTEGITKKVAEGLNVLANNLDTVVTVAVRGGEAYGLYRLAMASADLAARSTAKSAALQAAASAEAAAATAAHGVAAARASAQVAGYGAAATAAGAQVAAGSAAASAASVGGWRVAAAGVGAFIGKLGLIGTAAYAAYEVTKLAFSAGDNLLKKWSGLTKAEDDLAIANKKYEDSLKATKAAQEADAAAKQVATDKAFGLSKASAELVSKFDVLVKGGKTVSEAIGEIGKGFDLSTLPGIQQAAGVLDKLATDGKLSAAQFNQAWSEALKGVDLAEMEVKARAALAGTARGAIELQQVLDAGVREAIKRTGLDFDVIAGGMGKASRSAINDTNAIINGLDSLKAKGVDTGQALAASLTKGINSADSVRALDEVKRQIEQVRGALGSKVADGLLDQAKTKAIELSDALDKAKPGVTSLREAMTTLGLTSREELQSIADKALSAYDTIKQAGAQEGESFVAWQNRKAEAARVMLERVTAANGGVAPEWAKSKAAVDGVTASVNENGKSIIRNSASSKKAIGEVTNAFDAQAQAARNAAIAAANKPYERPGDDKDRYGRPQAGSQLSVSAQANLPGNGANDMSFQFGLRDKLVNGTLTQADAADLAHLIKVMRGNEAIDRSATASKSFEGMRDQAYWQKIREDMEYALAKLNAPSTPTPDSQTNTPAPDTKTPSGASSRSVYVNINTPRGTERVLTDDAGAKALVRGLTAASQAAR